jgi:hypothetical protein
VNYFCPSLKIGGAAWMTMGKTRRGFDFLFNGVVD